MGAPPPPFSRPKKTIHLVPISFLLTASATAQQKPYRLESVDLKPPIIWGTEIKLPDGTGLAFGGQDQTSDDGRPHTRILVEGEWKRIDADLRKNNPLQPFHEEIWDLRMEVKGLLSKARFLFLKGLGKEEDQTEWDRQITPLLRDLNTKLERIDAGLPETLEARPDAEKHVGNALTFLPTSDGSTAEFLKSLSYVQLHLELAADATAAEPPPRALACGPKAKTTPAAVPQSLVHEPKSKKYILFGGDHLDYLTNDLWIFDPAIPRWEKQFPKASPPPRANHHLTAPGDGTIRMTGGYTYTSNTDYVGGQYIDLDDGEWVYDIAKSAWSHADGKEFAEVPERTYRTGPFLPEHFLAGDRPDAAAFQKWLSNIPTNEWVATDPPFRPRLNRDWGTARLDPDRDLILRWSGGHSAHGGTDVPHFHLSTNRWELPFPVEFPLGQLYSNTSYPNGYNFNLRPWVTGHTYQNYAYDIPSRTMVFAGRPNHFYIYDPDKADWVSRGKKPKAMCYNSCFYTLTLTSTPSGALCWDKNGAVHLFDSKAQTWNPIETEGAKLPGAYVDNSSIVYDSKRDRALIVNTPGYNKPYTGQIWALDLKSHAVTELSPAGMEHAHRLATIDKSTYDPGNDLMLFGTHLKEAGDGHTPQPAYDCANNRWITLDLKYQLGERYGKPVRLFPHTRSDALMFDPKRKLTWGVDTNGQVYVLRLDQKSANPQPLTAP